jgi:NADPH-dependent 2,4-dienoyl-CoA reductase/sulfur reductase-like enzyme
VLGAKIGAVFQKVHEREGVVFRLNDEIVAAGGEHIVKNVRLRSGAVLDTDMVVVGLGVAPATDMLSHVPRREDGGVTVNARLELADGIYAAGDIAAFPYRGDGAAVRVEHWRVAQQQGRVAALNMLGRPVAFDAVPYFWTIHFLKRLDYVGHAESWDDIVVDGDLDKPQFVAFYLKDGVVTAIAGWDRDRHMAAAIALMTDKRDWALVDLRAALANYSE